MPPQLLRGRGLTAEQAAISGIGDGTVRLSIGIEDTDDLIEDLDAALSRSRDCSRPAPGADGKGALPPRPPR